MQRKHFLSIFIIAFFVGALGSILLGHFVLPYLSNFRGLGWLSRITTNAPIVINHTEQVQLSDGANMIDLAKQGSKSTVSFYQVVGQTYKFAGNGIILSTDGLIFATRQVLSTDTSGKEELLAVLNDGTSYPATIRAEDPRSNIVAVTITAKNLAIAQLADARALQPGQRIFALGSSSQEFNQRFASGFLTQSVTDIASIDHLLSSDSFQEFVLTDASLDANFVGGPVLNLDGKVVGMVSTVNPQMILPAEDIQTALSSYLYGNGSKIVRLSLGIQYYDLSSSLAKLKGVSAQGALVQTVAETGPGKKIGLLANDLIIEVDGQAIDENNSFEYLLNRHAIGDDFKLKIVRDGKEMELTSPATN